MAQNLPHTPRNDGEEPPMHTDYQQLRSAYQQLNTAIEQAPQLFADPTPYTLPASSLPSVVPANSMILLLISFIPVTSRRDHIGANLPGMGIADVDRGEHVHPAFLQLLQGKDLRPFPFPADVHSQPAHGMPCPVLKNTAARLPEIVRPSLAGRVVQTYDKIRLGRGLYPVPYDLQGRKPVA